MDKEVMLNVIEHEGECKRQDYCVDCPILYACNIADEYGATLYGIRYKEVLKAYIKKYGHDADLLRALL